MANTNKYQGQLDDLIIQQERLKDKIEQAKASLDHFRASTASTSKADAKAAKKRLEAAEKEKRFFESMFDERKKQIEEHAKQAGVNVKERKFEEIAKEENGNKSAFSVDNFKANLKSKGGGGKYGIAGGVANIIGDVFNLGADIYVAEQKKAQNTWMAQQDIYLKTLDTGSKIFQRHMKTFGKGMNGALKSTFAGITQGVQEGAYSAASTSVDFATESLTNKFQDQIDRLQMTNYAVARKQQAELENQKLTNQEINGTVGLASGILGMFGPMGQIVGGLLSTSVKNITKIQEAQSELELEKLKKEQEVAERQLQAIQDAKTQAVETAKEAVSSVLDFSKAIENLSLKTDAAAKSMANIIGMSGSNADMYERFIYGATRNLKFTDSTGKTTYLNKNAEDMLKMQSQYIDASERNGTMSQNDFVKTFQLGKVIGDDNLAATLLGDMDYFNKSIATGTDLIFEMFKEANKAGVSNRKFAKDLQQNLKLAQKYTFKGGTEGMMKMSIWAQKVRFNMQSLEGMVDKIQDGGLEGVITQAAKLQVLGGNMAMGADPLAMTYEAWANPEDLAKRFTDMTKGTGHFNSKTGEVDIVGTDAMRLKQYAEAIGMDYKDARAQVTQRIKGEQIDKQLYKKYTDEQKALIYNKAKLGENGQWQVTLDNGEVRNVNDINDTDWNSLMPTEESIEDYVSRIYNLLEKQGGVTNHTQSVMTDETFGNLKDNIEQRISDNLTFIDTNSARLKDMVEKSNNFVTEQNRLQQEKMVATAAILDQEFAIINKTVENFTKDLTDGSSKFRLALDAVAAELGIGSKSIAEANDALAKAILSFAEKVNTGNELIEHLTKRAEAHEKFSKQEMQRGNVGTSLGHDADALRIRAQIAETKGNKKEARKLENASRGNEAAAGRALGFGIGMRDGIAIGGNTSMSVVASTVTPIHDGMVSANGKPMYSKAASVTPIHDGSIQTAKSDPKDVALFAKTGGPFDKLFNGIFSRIDAVYNMLGGNTSTSSTINQQWNKTIKNNDPIEMMYESFNPIKMSGKQRLIVKALTDMQGVHEKEMSSKIQTLPMKNTNEGDVISHQWDIAASKDTSLYSSSTQPMELRISGSLELQSGGQSVDIMGMLRDNPLFVRELSRLLVSQLSNAQNGGRGNTNLSFGGV